MGLEEHMLMGDNISCSCKAAGGERQQALRSMVLNVSQFLTSFLKSLWLCNLFFHRQKYPCFLFITILIFCSLLCLFLFMLWAYSKPLLLETEWLTDFKYVLLITIATSRRKLSESILSVSS